ncbi:predicted periplasmic ligand-binding sensor domain, partial [Paenibacillus popilliae ATCC 14706]
MDPVMVKVAKADGNSENPAPGLASDTATLNGDKLTLTFNGALDKTSAEEEANYKVEKEDAQGT